MFSRVLLFNMEYSYFSFFGDALDALQVVVGMAEIKERGVRFVNLAGSGHSGSRQAGSGQAG